MLRPGQARIVSPDTLTADQRIRYEAALAQIEASRGAVADSEMTLTATAWYTIDGPPGSEPEALFVVLAGDHPVASAPFLFDRREKRLVNGEAVCSRYLSMGDPGATQISVQRARVLLERWGASMDMVMASVRRLAAIIQYPEPDASA